MSEDRSVNAIKDMAGRIKAGKEPEIVDKVMGEILFEPIETEFVPYIETKQKDTSSGNEVHVFYEMKSIKGSPFVTSGICQDHTLTREVNYDELTFLSIKYHEVDENGVEIDGLLCLNSTETFVVPEASHHQYLSKFCVIEIYTIGGPLSKLSEIL